MPGCARGEIFDETEVGLYHCTSRCVRRAFLCGYDDYSKTCYEHRREWIRQRLIALASVFAIDVANYSVMTNHLHVVLRNRPDIACQWSDDEVIRRWLRLNQQQLDLRAPPTDEQVEEFRLKNSPSVAEVRRRLSHISNFMAMLDESVSRASNREDQCSGHFWEERFHCQALLDEAAVLACSIYVDLNPIRACLADTPETSCFTSIFDRILDRQAAAAALANSGSPGTCDAAEDTASEHKLPHSGWMPPLSEYGDGYAGVAAGRRASDTGLLPLTFDQYLQLLDWTGRQLRNGSAGAIPNELAPILDRLNVQPIEWLKTVGEFSRRFGYLVGSPNRVRAQIQRSGRRWRKGVRACRTAFR